MIFSSECLLYQNAIVAQSSIFRLQSGTLSSLPAAMTIFESQSAVFNVPGLASTSHASTEQYDGSVCALPGSASTGHACAVQYYGSMCKINNGVDYPIGGWPTHKQVQAHTDDAEVMEARATETEQLISKLQRKLEDERRWASASGKAATVARSSLREDSSDDELEKCRQFNEELEEKRMGGFFIDHEEGFKDARKAKRRHVPVVVEQVCVPMDPYSTLGVSPDADFATVKSSYKRLAMKYHPDKNRHSRQAEEMFKLIHDAYEHLCLSQSD